MTTADPVTPGGAETVTLSAAERRRLLVRAGERPDGLFVRIADQTGGLHPSEAHVRIATEDGSAYCFVARRRIVAGHVSVGWPVGEKPGFWLVEMPRECDDGRWRLWVPMASVTREPEAASLVQETSHAR